MEPNFQTSFIPKRPMIEKRAVPARSVGILDIIAIFILFVVLLGTGALYFYKGSLTTNITQRQIDLDKAKNRFEPAKITELQLLDKRLRASSEILSNHTTILPIFQELSAITMKTVRYTKFSYSIGTEKNAKLAVQMSGIAVGYRSVALQADLFTSKGKNFINPIFSNLTLDNSGNILFDLNFSIDPAFVNYKATLLSQS